MSLCIGQVCVTFFPCLFVPDLRKGRQWQKALGLLQALNRRFCCMMRRDAFPGSSYAYDITVSSGTSKSLWNFLRPYMLYHMYIIDMEAHHNVYVYIWTSLYLHTVPLLYTDNCFNSGEYKWIYLCLKHQMHMPDAKRNNTVYIYIQRCIYMYICTYIHI